MLIFKQIPLIMREMDAISKDRTNTTQGFKFRGIDDVYNCLHDLLGKHEVFTVPTVLSSEHSEHATKNGGSINWVILKMQYEFFASDGSKVTAVVTGEAMDTADKASNKAMAIAHKYAMLQVFAIPTEGDNDPDASYHGDTWKGAQASSKAQALQATISNSNLTMSNPAVASVVGAIHAAIKEPDGLFNEPSYGPLGSAPFCCDKPMMISKYEDKVLGGFPWYCAKCKKKEARV